MTDKQLNKGKKEIRANDNIYYLFNEKTELINNLLLIDNAIKKESLINSRDKILFNFLIKYLRKTKKLNEIIIIFKRIKKIHKNLILN